MAPETRPETPASSMLPRVACAAATPRTRLAVDRMPSSAPRTAARSHPVRCVRWCSMCGIAFLISLFADRHSQWEHATQRLQLKSASGCTCGGSGRVRRRGVGCFRWFREQPFVRPAITVTMMHSAMIDHRFALRSDSCPVRCHFGLRIKRVPVPSSSCEPVEQNLGYLNKSEIRCCRTDQKHEKQRRRRHEPEPTAPRNKR